MRGVLPEGARLVLILSRAMNGVRKDPHFFVKSVRATYNHHFDTRRMLQDHWLILKYVGGIVAAFYGLYATVTDFKEQKNGKPRLTWRGWLGISVLVMSSALSLVADHLKDKAEATDKAAAQEKLKKSNDETRSQLGSQLKSSTEIVETLNAALRNLEADTHTTSEILSQTKKAAHPLGNFLVSFEFELAAEDPLLRTCGVRWPANWIKL